MRVPAILLSILFAASASAIQASIVKIFSIDPDHGPITGGTTVTITGVGFASGVLVDPPCIDGLFLTIGGTAPTITDASDTKIVAVTKPYTAGKFDVEVNPGCATAVLKNGFTYGDTDWQRALLPVVLAHDAPGAHGSLWRTELAGYVGGPFGGRVTGDPTLVCIVGGNCPGSTMPGPFVPFVDTDQHTPGRMIYIEPKSVFLNLRVRDVNGTAQNFGTELPVVSEDEMIKPAKQIPLQNVPLASNYRSKLRIYRTDIGDPTDITVVVRNPSTNAEIARRPLRTSAEPQTSGFLFHPGYAELDIDPMPELAGNDRANVVVYTPPEGLWYAFVSVTNNDTQLITTIRPR